MSLCRTCTHRAGPPIQTTIHAGDLYDRGSSVCQRHFSAQGNAALIEPLASNAYLVRVVCEGERSTWTEISKLQNSDGRLVVTDVHSTTPRLENRTRMRPNR